MSVHASSSSSSLTTDYDYTGIHTFFRTKVFVFCLMLLAKINEKMVSFLGLNLIIVIIIAVRGNVILLCRLSACCSSKLGSFAYLFSIGDAPCFFI